MVQADEANGDGFGRRHNGWHWRTRLFRWKRYRIAESMTRRLGVDARCRRGPTKPFDSFPTMRQNMYRFTPSQLESSQSDRHRNRMALLLAPRIIHAAGRTMTVRAWRQPGTMSLDNKKAGDEKGMGWMDGWDGTGWDNVAGNVGGGA